MNTASCLSSKSPFLSFFSDCFWPFVVEAEGPSATVRDESETLSSSPSPPFRCFSMNLSPPPRL